MVTIFDRAFPDCFTEETLAQSGERVRLRQKCLGLASVFWVATAWIGTILPRNRVKALFVPRIPG